MNINEAYNHSVPVVKIAHENGQVDILTPINGLYTINVKEAKHIAVDDMPINKYVLSFKTKGEIIVNTDNYSLDSENNGIKTYSRIYTHGAKVEKPKTYTRGYESLGWEINYTDVDMDTYYATSDVTLMEKSSPHKFKITVDYSANDPTSIKTIEYGAKTMDVLGSTTIPSTSSMKFGGWYFDNVFTQPIPENFDFNYNDSKIVDTAPDSEGISAKFSAYAKLNFNLDSSYYNTTLNDNVRRIYLGSNVKLKIIIPESRTTDIELIYENNTLNLSYMDNMKYAIEILASNINVNIIVKGTNKLYGFSGRDASYLQNTDTNAYNGGIGYPAILTKSNITFTSVDGGQLYLYGGNGGDGYWSPNTKRGGNGGNGASALYAEKNVTFKDFKNGAIYAQGGDGGWAALNYNVFMAGGAGGDGMTVNGALVFDNLNQTTITIYGGNGGFGGNTDYNSQGQGGKAGHAIIATEDVSFLNSTGLTLTLRGGNGGQSAALEWVITGFGGNGIKSSANIYFKGLVRLKAIITGGQHGYQQYFVTTLTGAAGISANTLEFQSLTTSNVEVVGGEGFGGDTQKTCGKGGNAVDIQSASLTSSEATTVTFKGGKGGWWSANWDPSTDGYKDMGQGYQFSIDDKNKASSNIVFVDGITSNTGNPNDWETIS